MLKTFVKKIWHTCLKHFSPFVRAKIGARVISEIQKTSNVRKSLRETLATQAKRFSDEVVNLINYFSTRACWTGGDYDPIQLALVK